MSNVIAFPSREPDEPVQAAVAPDPSLDFDGWYEVEVLDFLGNAARLDESLDPDEFWTRARVVRDIINSWPIPAGE